MQDARASVTLNIFFITMPDGSPQMNTSALDSTTIQPPLRVAGPAPQMVHHGDANNGYTHAGDQRMNILPAPE
ncbi:MAG: hypothetical protein KGK05_09695, partial [Xanthomonadaceae bacterium]|nr:hypothetical protein [Xanthomonadaceae bacterium]